MINSVNSREVVLEILTEVLENNKYSHIVLREKLNKLKELDKTNRSFITKISEGTIENLLKIDYIINQYSKIKVEKMKPIIRNLLRMSVYQLLFMDSVPDSAVCNEAVKITAKRGLVNLKGFVNGVLRTIARNRDCINYPKPEKNLIKAYSIQYSMPEWILSLWLKEYGQITLENILKGLSQERNLSVRCNLSMASKDEIIEMLEKQSITVEQSNLLEEALFLRNYDSLDVIQAHQKGIIQVQDISSMLVGKIAQPKAGDTVIDVCAAPGGKSLHIADLLKGTGFVQARDVSEYKTNLIQENINRIGFKNIQTIVKDATVFDKDSVAKADILIADLPCSGLGVMAKKTDIKYKIRSEMIDSLVNLQREILKTVESYVKPGGVLIYSTCTVNREENDGNVEWFLKNYPFVLESIDEYLPKELKNETSNKGYLQLFPGMNQTDGFFLARFRRCADE